MADHAVLAPSSASRRRGCSGSLTMEAMYPQTEDSDVSREGTAAHEVAEKLVRAASRAGIGEVTVEKMVGTPASNGVIITDEMLEAAQVYADDVRDVMRKIYAFNPAVESRVNASAINPECWGTPDCTLHDAKNKTVHIWDFKFGHRVVDAFENWQMIEYAAGLYRPGEDERFVLTIVQPRASHRDGPVRRWVVTASELDRYIAEAAEFEAKALSPDAMCTPEPAACRDCRGRHACESLQLVGYSHADLARQPIPLELSPEALGVELRYMRSAAALLNARLTGLEAQAEGLIQSGTAVPGFALEAGSGRLTWNAPADEVFAMGDMLGKDLRRPPEPITPTQAKKKGVDASVISAYAHTPKTGVKLVESSQTRAALVFAKKGENHAS